MSTLPVRPLSVGVQLDCFAPADRAKMCLSARLIAALADGRPRTKREWATVAGCSEHAVSARLSDLRRSGYRVARHKPNDTGEVCGIWTYSVERGA